MLRASTGKWVFRFEGAYVATENPSGKDRTKEPSSLHAVLGAERPFGERVRAQTQLIARWHPEWYRPDSASLSPVDRGIAGANAVLFDYTSRVRPASTLRVAFDTEDERYASELFVLVDWVAGDGVVRPTMTWRVSDALRFMTGAETFFGPRRSPLGAFTRYSGVFVGARYSF